MLSVVVHSADIHDNPGARFLLNRELRRAFPRIKRVYADAAYGGPKLATAVAKQGGWVIEVVRRIAPHTFVALPKRWIVERTLAWISRNRRLARDYERYVGTVEAFCRLAMIRIMLRRLTKPNHCS